MCQTISGIAVYDGETLKVFTSKIADSHSGIRNEYHIRDESIVGISSRQTPVELIPITSLFDKAGMEFKFDDNRPIWWIDEMTVEAIIQLHTAWLERWDNKILNFPGSINLGNLTSIPKGISLSAGGDFNLESLVSIPEGVSLSAGGNLYLGSLVSIPEGISLSAGGDLYLGSLTSISEGVSLSAGSFLYLGNLTSISEGVLLSAGGDLNLESFVSIPEGVSLKVKGKIYLKS